MTRRRCGWLGAVVVGLAVSAGAQDPLVTLPKNYWMEFQNPWVKVIHAHYPAGETLAVHDHPATATLYVYLNDAGELRFLHSGPHELPVTRKPVQTGQMRIAAARAETHRVENMSATDSDSLRVEFQTIKFPQDMPDVRIPPADAAFWAMAAPNAVVYEDARVRVTRLGVAPGREKFFRSAAKDVLWIAVRVEGASFGGKAANAGQCWDSSMLGVKAGKEKVEVVEVEEK